MTLKNKKAKGTIFEHRVRDLFKSKGFFVVRQASSAFPDLVVVCDRIRKEVNGYTFDGDILFVECKVGGILSPEEILHFKHLKDLYNVRLFCAYPLGSAYDVKSGNIVLKEIYYDEGDNI